MDSWTEKQCRIELGFKLALDQCLALQEIEEAKNPKLRGKTAVIYLLQGPEPGDRYVGSTTKTDVARLYMHNSTVKRIGKTSKSTWTGEKRKTLHQRMLETNREDWYTEELETCPAALRFAYELKWVLDLDTISNGFNQKLPYNACISRQDLHQVKYYAKKMYCKACKVQVARLSLCVHERSKKHQHNCLGESFDGTRESLFDVINGVDYQVDKVRILDAWRDTFKEWKLSKQAKVESLL